MGNKMDELGASIKNVSLIYKARLNCIQIMHLSGRANKFKLGNFYVINDVETIILNGMIYQNKFNESKARETTRRLINFISWLGKNS